MDILKAASGGGATLKKLQYGANTNFSQALHCAEVLVSRNMLERVDYRGLKSYRATPIGEEFARILGGVAETIFGEGNPQTPTVSRGNGLSSFTDDELDAFDERSVGGLRGSVRMPLTDRRV